MPDPPLTVAEILRRWQYDDRPALLFEDRSWTWREYVAACDRRARALSRLASGGRLHVGVLMDNVPEYLFLIGAAALSGATIVGINPTRRGEELAADIRGTDCNVILAEDHLLHLLDDLDTGVRRTWGPAEWDKQVADAATTPYQDATDPAATLLLLFTSGSTGAPKAVICSTGRLARIASYNSMGLTVDDVAYNAMPLFHGNALMAAWASCLSVGAAFAMRRRFSASGFLPDIQKHGATFFNYVGRSLAYVLARPESPGERDHALRFGFGTEASGRDRAEFLRRFGCPVFESYGSSEGGCYIVVGADTPEGSLGRAQVGHDVVVLDQATGAECPVAQWSADGLLLNGEEATGEIVNRAGAAMFEGYYANPDAGRERIRGAAYHTGDLGYRDAEGFFYFAGRTSDWLRVDSENFAAAPVERILARMPGVRLAAVYAVPDSRTGDQVMAALEVEDGFDVGGIGAFLDRQPDLGSKWAPRYVRLSADVPVTATRKIDKPTLRRCLWSARGDDVVLVREPPSYRVMTDADRDAVLADFAEHGRTGLLP